MSSARLRTGPSWPRREQYAVCTVAPVQRAGGNRRASSVAVWTSLGTSGVLEALTVSEIENKAAWAISPWKADPYHTAVYLAQFPVPVLALLIVLRLLTRGALTEPDRAQQAVRAAGVMVALIGLTRAFEGAAVIGGANPSPWGAWTSLQAGGLAVVSVLAVGAAVLLAALPAAARLVRPMAERLARRRRPRDRLPRLAVVGLHGGAADHRGPGLDHARGRCGGVLGHDRAPARARSPYAPAGPRRLSADASPARNSLSTL